MEIYPSLAFDRLHLFFPKLKNMLVQIDSNDKNVLIIGGDKSLLQSLVKGGAIVTVVAKKENISSDLVDLLSSGEVAWFNRSALARDVAGKG